MSTEMIGDIFVTPNDFGLGGKYRAKRDLDPGQIPEGRHQADATKAVKIFQINMTRTILQHQQES